MYDLNNKDFEIFCRDRGVGFGTGLWREHMSANELAWNEYKADPRNHWSAPAPDGKMHKLPADTVRAHFEIKLAQRKLIQNMWEAFNEI